MLNENTHTHTHTHRLEGDRKTGTGTGVGTETRTVGETGWGRDWRRERELEQIAKGGGGSSGIRHIRKEEE